MGRKRDYIPLPERLAAALACLLPQAQRDSLRAKQAPADEVLALFHNDHIVHHAIGGSDKWWNLDPKQIAAHKEKTAKIDIPMIAKGKRIRRKQADSAHRLLEKYGIKLTVSTSPELDKMLADMPKRPRPKPKLWSRPFNRGIAPKDKRPPLTKTVPRRLTPA